MRPAAVGGALPLVDEPLGERAHHVGRRAEVGEVSPPLPGHERVQRVVQIVRPERRAAPAARRRLEHAAIVPVVLGHHVDPPPGPPAVAATAAHSSATRWRALASSMAWVASRRSTSTLKSRTHCSAAPSMSARTAGAARPVVVEAVTPGRAVTVGEVGPERREVVPLRAEVVVDDVERDREAEAVRPVDEPLQRRRPAVRLVHRPRRHAVVPPVPLAGEGLHRHQLDAGDAQLGQVRQARRRRVERPLGGEGPDVQLVEHERLEGQAAEVRVAPGVAAGIEQLRRAVHAARLAARGRVRQRAAVREHELILGAVGGAGHLHRPAPRPPGRMGWSCPSVRTASPDTRGAQTWKTAPAGESSGPWR